jgi:hypothetical protein
MITISIDGAAPVPPPAQQIFPPGVKERTDTAERPAGPAVDPVADPSPPPAAPSKKK